MIPQRVIYRSDGEPHYFGCGVYDSRNRCTCDYTQAFAIGAGQTVLVCGGRNYTDQQFINSTLDEFHRKHGIKMLIEGGARGADSLARTWAIINRIKHKTFKANWNVYGRSAGGVRNKQMLEEGKPDIVIAFSGGSGTANMIRQAIAVGISVYQPSLGEWVIDINTGLR